MIQKEYDIHPLKNAGEIYMATSKTTGQKYIGQAKCIAKRGRYYIEWGGLKRWNNHVNESSSETREGCRKLNNFISKYGADDFEVEILVMCNLDQLNEYETKFIEVYDTLYPKGLNLKIGGEQFVYSEETIKKMSDAAKGRTNSQEARDKISAKNLAKPSASDETRERLRKSNTGKIASEETRKKIGAAQYKLIERRLTEHPLPEYINRMEQERRQGYRVSKHPYLQNKTFTSTRLTMEQKLELAVKYTKQNFVNSLDYKPIEETLTGIASSSTSEIIEDLLYKK